MTTVHIYTAPSQPPWNFVDYCTPTPHRVRWSKHKLAWCGTCGRRRRLGNLRVQVFYDALKFYCTEPCKSQRRRR